MSAGQGGRTTDPQSRARYCDHYQFLSFAAFTRHEADGTLDSYEISEGEI